MNNKQIVKTTIVATSTVLCFLILTGVVLGIGVGVIKSFKEEQRRSAGAQLLRVQQANDAKRDAAMEKAAAERRAALEKADAEWAVLAATEAMPPPLPERTEEEKTSEYRIHDGRVWTRGQEVEAEARTDAQLRAAEAEAVPAHPTAAWRAWRKSIAAERVELEASRAASKAVWDGYLASRKNIAQELNPAVARP